MKRLILSLGFLLVFGTATAAAQTHVSLSIGFGVPVYVPGVVVVGRPSFYRPPVVLVVPRAYAVRPMLVERVIVTRHHYRPYHRVRVCRYGRCGH